jgi:hypothetical protein
VYFSFKDAGHGQSKQMCRAQDQNTGSVEAITVLL